jgi:prevent-host-death family protein
VTQHDPNLKGNVAEAAAVFHATRLGIPVFRALAEHGRYDLVMEIGGELRRIQCKSGTRKRDVIVVRIASNRRGADGFIRTFYSRDQIDAVVAYCAETDDCYYLPIELIDGMTAFQLRLAPPKNGQRAGLNFAADYALGAIAQLGERVAGSDEVVGSSPTSSTQGSTTVGAHEFRNRFGWYMQRAAAGEAFNVTRRGKPYVRLTGPQDSLDLTGEPTKVARLSSAELESALAYPG